MKKVIFLLLVANAFLKSEGMFHTKWKLIHSNTGKTLTEYPDTATNIKISPTFENVSYGNFVRNILDFWKAESLHPTPLVVYIHGGGFISGSKAGARQEDIKKCLDNGISFAAINYRFRKSTRLDTIMFDCARAIQFLRSKSTEWNIDKTKVAAYGGSAGGGASLWLGVHDDLADPENPDPVFRESSKLQVIGHLNSQATYDFTKWSDIVGIPSNWMDTFSSASDLNFTIFQTGNNILKMIL